MTADQRPAAGEPASWGELCNSYRASWGGRALATVAHPGAARQQRFARSVPAQCPLAETRHPLYATGEDAHIPCEPPRARARAGLKWFAAQEHGGPRKWGSRARAAAGLSRRRTSTPDNQL